MHYLVTGGAGFIGSHLTEQLLAEGHQVTILDNLDPFYDPEIKKQNISAVIDHPKFTWIQTDIRDLHAADHVPSPVHAIIHIAARAGVRPSIADPIGYYDTNVKGTLHLLEFAKTCNIEQFVFASSSSVYGINPQVPWKEDTEGLQPISPYAATKLSCEGLGHVYSKLYDIRFIALRFFTVYGPRQRPDLAIHKFAKKILTGEPIPLFGDGSTRRDYTYITDILSGIRAAIDYKQTPFEILNLGNDRTISLAEMVQTLEDALGKKAIIDQQPEQPGDVPQTWADISKTRKLLGYQPSTTFKEGVEKFAEWLRG
jgi:UDP-glucuronate 4-epimerase